MPMRSALYGKSELFIIICTVLCVSELIIRIICKIQICTIPNNLMHNLILIIIIDDVIDFGFNL